MENIVLLRHYIFINPNDILGDINNSELLNKIKETHNKNYTNGEVIKYYGYNDIVYLLHNYDKELCNLFLELNHNYPALLADIGRLIILYNYGGIYHDLKFMSNKKMINYLMSLSSEIELICEEHPTDKDRIRNGNIIALHKNSKFLISVLEKMKIKLINRKHAFGPKTVYDIGSKTYINEFYNKNAYIYKYPFRNLINSDANIYLNNLTKWQNTYENIFKIKT
jgi:hypothetical protein